MLNRALLSATLIAIAAPAFAADDGTWDYWVRAQVSVGSIGLSGNAKYKDSGVSGTKFDMSDVGLDSREATPGFELGLTTPLLSFHGFAGYQAWSTDGSSTLSKTITFGGKTYTQGTTVDSKASISDLYAELNWAPIELDVAGFSVGLAVHQLGLKTELSSTGQTAKFDESATLPTLAVRGYVSPVSFLEAEAMVHGLAVPIGDATGSFLEAQAQISYYPINYVGVFVGYRQTMIDVSIKSGSTKAEANVSLAGPFLGVAARF